MKNKIFLFTILLLIFSVLFINNSFWAKSVQVTAVVWDVNVAPVIISTTPSSNPISIQRNKVQDFSIQVSDEEWDSITYTITAEVWTVSPISWTITNTTTPQYINFSYLAPSTKPFPNNKKIIITLNDWENLITKTIQLYIY